MLAVILVIVVGSSRLLLNRTCRLREHGIRVRSDQPDRVLRTLGRLLTKNPT
jgi:hypothetical protein